MTAATAAQRQGSRVSPRRRRPQGGRRASGKVARQPSRASSATDNRPYWLYMEDPERGLMLSDGVNYIGERLARREAAKCERHFGRRVEVRPSPRA